MLNKKKQIDLEIKNNISIPLFFNLPLLPSNSYLQANSNSKNLDHLNLIVNCSKSKRLINNLRFCFSSKIYRTFSLVIKYTRKKNLKITKFKKYLIFLNKLHKISKRYPFAVAKRIKGGFTARCLGIQTFMPSSHYLKKKGGGMAQILIQTKALRRKKKYFSKKNWKFLINLVSSARYAKNSTIVQFHSKKRRFSKKKV
jgi:hypothetical protein